MPCCAGRHSRKDPAWSQRLTQVDVGSRQRRPRVTPRPGDHGRIVAERIDQHELGVDESTCLLTSRVTSFIH